VRPGISGKRRRDGCGGGDDDDSAAAAACAMACSCASLLTRTIVAARVWGLSLARAAAADLRRMSTNCATLRHCCCCCCCLCYHYHHCNYNHHHHHRHLCAAPCILRITRWRRLKHQHCTRSNTCTTQRSFSVDNSTEFRCSKQYTISVSTTTHNCNAAATRTFIRYSCKRRQRHHGPPLPLAVHEQRGSNMHWGVRDTHTHTHTHKHM